MPVARTANAPGGRLRRPRQPGLLSRVLLFVVAFGPLVVFFYYPLVSIFVRSVREGGAAGQGALTFTHYVDLVSNSTNRSIILQTFRVALETAALTTLLAFPAALLLYRMDPRRARWVLGTLLVPSWTSFVVALFGLGLIMRELGLLFSHLATVIGMASYVLPYVVVILYSSMSAVDASLIHSARSLGASWSGAVAHVLLPLSRAGLYAGFLIAFIISLGFFLTPAMLGSPRDTSVSMYIQQQVQILSWGSASAMGMILLAAAVGGFYLVSKLARVNALGSLAQGGSRGTSDSAIVRMPAPSYVVNLLRLWMGGIFILVLAPIAIIVLNSFNGQTYYQMVPETYSLRWFREVLSDFDWYASLMLSLRIGAITALAATALGLCCAVYIERVARRAQHALRLLVMAPLIVPVILYGIAVYDIESRLGVEGSTLGFVLAHTVLALPFTFTLLAGSVAGASKDLEGAALSLGAPSLVAAWHSMRPQLVPALALSMCLAFITSWGEVVVSLILSDFQTPLPVNIYHHTRSELSPQTAAVSTLMIGVVVLTLAVFLLASRWTTRSTRHVPPRSSAQIGDQHALD